MTGHGRIVFANQLRGIAAISVVITHFCFTYWRQNANISPFFGANPTDLGQLISSQVFTHFYPGVFGVALFFLISGFVIPFSISSLSRSRFLTARAVRIYPTYWACFAYTLAAAYISATYWGNDLNYTPQTIIKNILLLHTIDGTYSLDLVNWTLAIEIKFYIIFAIFHRAITSGTSIRVLLISAAALLAANIFKGPIGNELTLISFMLIGTLFYLGIVGRITTTELLISSTALISAVVYFWNLTPWPDARYPIAANYAAALIVFSACYFLRHKFRESKTIDFFASISYPLYLVHAIPGYAIITILLRNGCGKWMAVISAAAISIAVAYAIHKLVEIPTNAYCKKLIAKGRRNPTNMQHERNC